MTSEATAPALAARLRRPSIVGFLGIVFVAALLLWLGINLVKAPSDFFEILLIGLTTGCVYALVALGYTLVYGILELINFAHGDVFMLGGMFTITFGTTFFNLHSGQGFVIVPIVFATLLLSMLACGVLNAAIELLIFAFEFFAGIIIDHDIRIDSVTFHDPLFAVFGIKRELRFEELSAIDKR